jgi:hypothetical protein
MTAPTRGAAGWLCGVLLGVPCAVQAQTTGTPEIVDIGQAAAEAPATDTGGIGDIDLTAGDKADMATKADRSSVGYELSLGDDGIVNSRGWFRLEYSKFFLESFYVRLDSKLNAFIGEDHRAEAEDRRVAFESITPEAFVQYSRPGANTAFRAGVQKLIWGESEGGAITDEVTPRNLSELFFIPLEESRIGQPMLNVDTFVSSGEWSAFYVPDAKFNKYPKRGTAYYVDAFGDAVDLRDATGEGNTHEFGGRWKKTVGRSDVSFMAASLVDNDYAYRADGLSASGRPQVARFGQRFRMVGAAFNYVSGDYQFKGEVGYKSPRAFNDAGLRVIEKNVVDSAFGVTYSLGQSNTIGVELVNSHVVDWDRRIVGVPRNNASLVINANLFFWNETLSMNWLTIYSRPYTSLTSSLRTSYKWDDATTVSVDLHAIDVPDTDSGLFRFRDRDQIFFRIQRQF